MCILPCAGQVCDWPPIPLQLVSTSGTAFKHGQSLVTLSQLQSLSCDHDVQVVNAVSTAVAKTVIHWNTYVCSCCIGNSAAYTVVKADIQVRK